MMITICDGFAVEGTELEYSAEILIPEYMRRVIYGWRTNNKSTPGPYVFFSGDYWMTRSDLESLEADKAISRKILDVLIYFLHCLNVIPYKRWNFMHHNHALMVPHMLTKELEDPEYTSVSQRELGRIRWLFLPYILDKHWLLVVFDFEDRKISAYNSIATVDHYKDRVHEFVCDWQRFLAERLQSSEIKSWCESFVQCLRQDKQENCALFVVKYVECIISGLPMDFDYIDVRSARGVSAYNKICSSVQAPFSSLMHIILCCVVSGEY